MISSIESIKNFGIYKDYQKCINTKDFERYNLFYGWNGSGKSTLVRILQMLETKLPAENCKFKIKMNDGSIVTEKNLTEFNENLYVFNQDFIENNIDWNGKINSILLLSNEKIEEIEEHKKLKAQLFGNDTTKGLIAIQEENTQKLSKDVNEIDKILSAIAKNIKSYLQIIASADKYYSNYNKTKVEEYIKLNIEKLRNNELMLSEVNVVLNTQAATPVKKEDIHEVPMTFNIKDFNNIEDEVEKLTRQIISAVVIDELKNNSELSNWVEVGLKIHKSEGKNVCAFCGGELTQERIVELEKHYNNALQILKGKLTELNQKLKSYNINKTEMVRDVNSFYPEFKDKVINLNQKLEITIQKLGDKLRKISEALDNKNSNPFIEIEYENQKLLDTIKEYEHLKGAFNELIKQHNIKNNEFDKITTNAKRQLEEHYINEQLLELDCFQKMDDISKSEKTLLEKSKEIQNMKKRYEELEAELSNETLGAEEFNDKLEQFLGYGDIKLLFDKSQKGYKIIRNGQEEAKNLSEGEKTSIAFLYFITKLKENGNNIKDMIIVIDDPISSFDSNKIFYSYAFLKKECRDAKQMFIFTHNYNYYSLVLGWLKKEKKKVDGKHIPEYALYRIETELDKGLRIGCIRSTGSGLTQNSEYDYVFYNVYKMKDRILDKEELIYSGNIARKLVESFLSFKFPAQRGDLKALIGAAFNNENEVTGEKIYRFVNVYSHHKYIDVYEQLDIDILDASSASIINDILAMIKRLDENHYTAMIKKAEEEICNNI